MTNKNVLAVNLPIIVNGRKIEPMRLTFVDIDRLQGLLKAKGVEYKATEVDAAINAVLSAEEFEGYSYGEPRVKEQTYFTTNGSNLTKAVVSHILSQHNISQETSEPETTSTADEQAEEEILDEVA